MTPLTPSALPDLQTPAHPSSHRKSPLATALLAALAPFVATAVATCTLVITAGYPGFATVLTALVATIFALALALLAILDFLFFLATKETSDLASQPAEEAFFLLSGFISLRCGRGRRVGGRSRYTSDGGPP